VNSCHENPQYLPGYKLHEGVVATSDIQSAVSESHLVFVAVPSAYFRTVVQSMKPALPADSMLVSTTKGIEAGSFLLMSQVMNEEMPEARIGVLSGPNLAGEIAKRSMTGTVVA